MLAGTYQVVDVLMLVGNIVPIAIYFLVLGLINSHSRPCIVTSRSDFVALTGVLLPLLLWPVPELIRSRLFGPLAGIMLVAGLIFYYMLPAVSAGFVVYNLGEARCRRLLTESLNALGLQGTWCGSHWSSENGALKIELRKFSLLRTVTLHFEAVGEDARNRITRIGENLHSRLHEVQQLPSPMGAGLVVLGVTLLILPMWMVGRHIHDLVDAVSFLLG